MKIYRKILGMLILALGLYMCKNITLEVIFGVLLIGVGWYNLTDRGA